jgi:hypothetical protein
VKLFKVVVGLCAVALLVTAFIAVWRARPDRALERREEAWHARIEPGDVVLQQLECGLRCDLFRDITHSRYTHAGVVIFDGRTRVVWEAFGPVGPTRLDEWAQRGKEQRLAVYRPSPAVKAKLEGIANALHGMKNLPDDPQYQWDDARLYASELVEKAFERGAQVQLVVPHPLGAGAFGSHADGVRHLTDGAFTVETPVVTPSDFAHSLQLTRVIDELEGEP